MIQNILFDFDGTLSDSARGIVACVRYALESFGIEETDPQRLLAFVGPPPTELFESVYDMTPEQSQAALGKFRERFAAQGIYENEMFPGVEAMLRRLRGAGKRLALATSKPRVFAREILERYGVADCFDLVMGCELSGGLDTKIQVMEEVLRQLDITTPEARAATVMVGDRKYDMEGARHCGVRAVGVAFGYAPPGELEASGADVILPTVEALTDYLLEH